MRKLLVALFLLFPVIASAQIAISPSRVAYNTEGQILTVSGSFRPGNVGTFVDFTYTDGGVAEVEATSVNSESITCEIPLSVTGQPGLWAVSVVFVDDTGVRTDGNATLTIFANLPPVLNVPEVVTAEATSPAGAAVNFADEVGGFSFADPPPAPAISCSPASGSVFPLGSSLVTCTATDSVGSTSASFRIFVGDTTGPVITVPASFIGTNPVTYSVSAVDAVDGARPVTCFPASGTTFPIGVTTVQCSASDLSDNFSFASFQIGIGQPAPTLTLPANMTVISDDNVGITVAYTATADQDATVVCNPAPASFFPVGTTTVHCTATNVFGQSSSGSFTITVIPNPLPTLIVPSGITVSPTSSAGAVVTYTVTATDAVDGTLTPVCTPLSGSTFAIGSTQVVCSVTNSRGYTRLGSFYVYVIDAVPPVLHLPSTIHVTPSGSPDGTEVNYDAYAVDDVDGTVPASCEPASGSLFPNGTTTVQCTATDTAGNRTSGSFDVVVSADTTPPVINVPASIVREATGPTGAVVTYTVTATDDVDGSVPVNCSPISGSTFPIGVNPVTCTARDAAGNVGMASFNVTVQDTTPPTLHLPSDITVTADANCSAVVNYTATATDIVDGTDPVVCTPASGSSFALGTTTVNCSSTDHHSNTATGSFHVTVQDTTPPTIRSLTATPSNIWPENHKIVDVTIVADVVDNCDAAPVTRIVSVDSNQPILGPGSGNTTPDWNITGNLTVQLRAERTNNQDRTYTLTVTSTDASGNTSTSTVVVYVAQANNGN
jgi:hypothetical protein